MKPTIVKKLNVSDEKLQCERTLFTSNDCTLMVEAACKELAGSQEIVLLPRQEYDRLCLADSGQELDSQCSSEGKQHKNDEREDLHEGEPVMVADSDFVFSLRYYFQDGMASDRGLNNCYTYKWKHIIPFSMFNPNNETELLFSQFDFGSEGNREIFKDSKSKKKGKKHRSGVYFKDDYANNLNEY